MSQSVKENTIVIIHSQENLLYIQTYQQNEQYMQNVCSRLGSNKLYTQQQHT